MYKEIVEKLKIATIPGTCSTGKEWMGKVKGEIEVDTPIDGSTIANISFCSREDYDQVVSKAQSAFEVWQKMPAPKRGEIVRQIGDKLRENKGALGKLVTLETGKIYQEGLGEVQEMIDICDFAVGLSRQLHGFTMHSERPEHRMYEQYHPMGVVGIISAFNFPVAVWSWNAMLAAVCGNVSIWKPSEITPLTAIACQKIVEEVLKENDLPEGIFNLVLGDASIGQAMAEDERVPLISATGSTRMGKAVAKTVAVRLGKSLLELGGNNAVIITPQANLDMALRAVAFGAVGTCGQRCTSTRRVILHKEVFEEFKTKLTKAYESLPIGDPLDQKTLVGPLINHKAVKAFSEALKQAEKEVSEPRQQESGSLL